jgi:hypothetical protein
MVMAEDFIVAEYCGLTPEERRLLEWLIANGTPAASSYAYQIPEVRVVARCTCGCPSLDLARGEKKTRTVGAPTILADAVGRSPEGVPVSVILHAREGEISELEVMAHDETQVFGLPAPETLEVV